MEADPALSYTDARVEVRRRDAWLGRRAAAGPATAFFRDRPAALRRVAELGVGENAAVAARARLVACLQRTASSTVERIPPASRP